MSATRRAVLLGSLAAALAPTIPAAQLQAPPSVPVVPTLWPTPVARPKRLQWMLADDFDDDGRAYELQPERNAALAERMADEWDAPQDDEVVLLRYYAEYPDITVTKHGYDEDADEYPPLTVHDPIPTDPFGEMLFVLDGAEYGNPSLDDALDDEDAGTYTVNCYAYSASIAHRWDAAAQRFIPVGPVPQDATALVYGESAEGAPA